MFCVICSISSQMNILLFVDIDFKEIKKPSYDDSRLLYLTNYLNKLSKLFIFNHLKLVCDPYSSTQAQSK
jgi:hypothetical protein